MTEEVTAPRAAAGPGRLLESLRGRLLLLLAAVLVPAVLFVVHDYFSERDRALQAAEQDTARVLRLARLQQEALERSARDLAAALAQTNAIRMRDAAACARLVKEVLPRTPPFVNIAATDRHGDLFCSAVPVASPRNYADRGWFQTARDTREAAPADYVIGRVLSRPLLIYGYPLENDAGDFAGVLAIAADLSWLRQLLASVELPPGSAAGILHAEQGMIAFAGDPSPATDAVFPVSALLGAIQDSRSDGILDVRPEGVRDRVYAYSTLATQGGNLYLVVGSSQESGYLAAERRLRQGLIVVAALALALFALLALAASRLIADPLSRLIAATGRLAAGDLTARTALARGPVEIRALSAAFDAMAAALARRDEEQAQTLAALRDGEERYRTLIDTTPDAIYVREGDYLTLVNPAAVRLFGARQADQLIGRSVFELVEPEYYELARRRMRRLESPASMLEPAIVKYRTLDGRVVEVEAVAANMTINGRPAVLGVLRDLAWRRRVERQLRDERQRFQLLVEGVRDYAIYMLDAEGNVASWNPGAARTTGYAADEILGQPMATFYTPEDRQAGVPRKLLAQAAAEGSCELDGLRVRKDGSRFWGSTLVSHLRDEQGAARGFAVLTRDITERRRQEEALRESEVRFRSLAESSSVGIWRNAPGGECIYLNRRACELIDLPVEQALGHGWARTLHPDDRARVLQEWQAFAGGGAHFRSEYRFLHRDGRVIHVIGEATPERVEGKVIGFVGTLTDITDLIQAEAELRGSEARYRYFFENSPVPMWIYDVANFEILDVNPATVDSLGYSREELLAMTIAQIRPAEDVDALRTLVASLGTGVNYSGVWRHRRKSGALVDFHIISHGFEFEGRAARLVFAVDLSERIAGERKVRESESRLSAVIESAMDAIITIDDQQRVLLFNSAAEAMFGWTEAELTGEPLDRLLPDRYRVRHGAHIRQFALASATNRRMGSLGTLFGLRRSGEEFPIEASISQVTLEGRKLFTVILRDVTERERAEKALREAQQRTEQLSRRIIDVQEQERNHLARELHDEIGQVLTAVRINLQGILRATADTATEDLVVETIDVTAQALEKVRGLSLDLRPAQLDDFGLGAALDWHLKRQAANAGLELELDLRLSEARLQAAVEIACFRVVQEAVTNVVRHAKARRVAVSVWCEGSFLRAKVRDDGAGFAADRMRQDATAGRSFGLMGMEERAALLGGRLDIASAAGQGTEINAWFPLDAERAT